MAREQLRAFLLRLGYDPVLSEYSDVLFDPRTHTHTSCLQEVPNADIVVVLIGSRFGGKIVPEALSSIDLENLINSSFDVTVLEEPEKLSITQLEVLKAVDESVPVFAFVESKVMHDHYVYQKNKDLVEKIQFPSLEKPESAKYIFEFINFLTHRNKGNSVISFSKVEDIENHLRKQWGGLFQRLLREQREQQRESRRIFTITEQIEDLKTAILSSMGNTQSREVARGVIRYRRLLDFLTGLNFPDFSIVIEGNLSFDKLFEVVDIVSVKEIPSSSHSFGRSALIKSDGTFYELRMSKEFISRLAIDWQNFSALNSEVRQIIFDTISEIGRMGPGMVRYRDEKFDKFFGDELELPELDDTNLEEIKAFLVSQASTETENEG